MIQVPFDRYDAAIALTLACLVGVLVCIVAAWIEARSDRKGKRRADDN